MLINLIRWGSLSPANLVSQLFIKCQWCFQEKKICHFSLMSLVLRCFSLHLISLPAFLSRIILRDHNITLILNMVKKVITDFDSTKVPGPGFILVEILENWDWTSGYIFFQYVSDGILFSILIECLICEPCVKKCWVEIYGERMPPSKIFQKSACRSPCSV